MRPWPMWRWRKTAPTVSTNADLAVAGEDLAARYLRRHGLRVLLRNFRCGPGELDIVACKGETLVFVEVKTRRNDEPSPESAVDWNKRRQVIGAAKVYLTRYGNEPPPVRFDIVGIVWPEGGEPEVRHIEHAFEA